MARKGLKVLDDQGHTTYEDALDWLGFTEAEKKECELAVKLARAIRRLRTSRGVTQRELAAELKTGQSRIAAIELPAGDVSLSLLFKVYFHLGGEVDQLDELGRPQTEAENLESTLTLPQPKKRPAAKPKAAKTKAKAK